MELEAENNLCYNGAKKDTFSIQTSYCVYGLETGEREKESERETDREREKEGER